MPQYASNLFSIATNNLQKFRLALLKNTSHSLEYQFPDFSLQCNRLCAQYIYGYLTAPLNAKQQLTINIKQLKTLLCITKNYEKFYDYMLDALIADGLLVRNFDLLQFNKTQNASWKSSELKMIYPMFRGTLTLLDHCVSHFSLALSEKIPAISVLYPEGSTAFMDKTFSEDTAEYTEMPIIRNIAVKLLSTLINELPSLKILEVGGGRGLITRELLDNITDKNIVEYHFTDISRRFVIDMKRHAKDKGLTFLTCDQFDITKKPIDQGIQLNTYDIILGLDVVHATPNIETTLRNLKSLLKAEGLLCLLETTNVQRWQNLIMGLTKGWWLFDDKWRKSIPLLSATCWKIVIEDSGFLSTNITTLQNKNSDAALIFASL